MSEATLTAPTPTAVRRLTRDLKKLKDEPIEGIDALPLDDNILEWHYIIHGSKDTPYAGGIYHGRLVFAFDFPWKPPSIYMSTPSGRFQPDVRLCLSISDYHPESWNPGWTVSAILVGLHSFMNENQHATGCVSSTDQAKKDLAKKSKAFNLRNEKFRKLFPGLAEQIEKEGIEALSAEEASAMVARPSRPGYMGYMRMAAADILGDPLNQVNDDVMGFIQRVNEHVVELNGNLNAAQNDLARNERDMRQQMHAAAARAVARQPQPPRHGDIRQMYDLMNPEQHMGAGGVALHLHRPQADRIPGAFLVDGGAALDGQLRPPNIPPANGMGGMAAPGGDPFVMYPMFGNFGAGLPYAAGPPRVQHPVMHPAMAPPAMPNLPPVPMYRPAPPPLVRQVRPVARAPFDEPAAKRNTPPDLGRH